MTHRMRVAYVLTQDRGGPVDATVTLAAAVLATGDVDVRVFGPLPSRGAAPIAAHHTPVLVARKGDLRAARAARAAVRTWRPDVVHAQDRRAGLVSARLRGGCPVVHTYHGVPDDLTEPWFRGSPDAPGPSTYSRAVLAADALLARTVTRTVVPSQAMGEFLSRRLRVPADRLAHIDNAVHLPDVRPPAGSVRRLLFAGLLVARKGLLHLLDALAVPGVMPPDAMLTVAGDGPQRDEAERSARRPELAGRVRFLGFRTDVPALLREHDALVLPSTMEQQPLVVAQAMAAGKPVVATDTGGVADMLHVPGTVSRLARPGDVAGLAARLRELFADPDPARTGGLLAARARERFAPETAARHHLRLYRELLSRQA
ncbi:glycosyltransferase family 4 protein [Actinophytocola sp. NPDC049390]|uniref:glycosyltransferase family 4 protein n=1 Tax=Actinophytocola sp. NPDC049390 TaxID=3363894 RepID=UPI00378AAC84